ncbi:MAG: sortase [Oscillospiraceae bacterium]|nr:sortase [Oscillospiraceae bacterium]
MSRKVGLWMMLLGLCMLLASGAWFLYNRHEDVQAGAAAQERLSNLIIQIRENQTASSPEESGFQPIDLPEGVWMPEEPTAPEPEEPQEPTMPALEVDGESYIGYLTMPTIDIELPIMADWNYDKLLRAPCYYYGTIETGNLVLMAHNYTRHFGKLSLLTAGAPIYFVDIYGQQTEYKVLYRETLSPDCVPELKGGVYDLTLFTCTYSGANRIVVRCEQVSP